MLEDKVAGAIGNTQIGKDLFKMGTFAPDWGELIGFSLLFYEAQRRKFSKKKNSVGLKTDGSNKRCIEMLKTVHFQFKWSFYFDQEPYYKRMYLK